MFGWLTRNRQKAVSITRSSELAKRLAQSNTNAGVTVTAIRAMQQATVFSCVKVRSETFAQLSPVVYERLPDGGKRRADEHWLARLLRERPGDEDTPFEFGERLSAEIDLTGNHYRYAVWKGEQIERLIHLPADEVEVTRDPTTRELRYKASGFKVAGREYFTRKEIIHARDLSLDGIKGLSKIEQCRNTVGIQIACERHAGNVFRNGASPNATMEFPHELTDDQHKRLQKDLDENWNGEKSNRTIILESGGKLVPFAIANRDAQFLETRQYGRTEICGIFRVPPHMVADLSRSTFNNIEHQSLEFVMYSILPLARRLESLWNSTLLYGTSFYVEYLIESLVRGDLKTRMDSYARGIQTGIMTPNEVRAKENLEPIEGAGGLFMMANVVPIGLAGQQAPVPAGEPDPEPDPAIDAVVIEQPTDEVSGDGV